jgi:hypothetical protein
MSKEQNLDDKDLAGIAGGTDVNLTDKPQTEPDGSIGGSGGGVHGGGGPDPETEDTGSGGSQDLSD